MLIISALTMAPNMALASDGLEVLPSASWYGDVPSGHFGESVTGGDFDGDGFADVLVSMPGRANIYAGSMAGPSADAAAVVTSSTLGFGFTAVAGDVNGDGFMDAAISSSWTQVDVFIGGPSFFGISTVTMPSEGWQFGDELAFDGDLNADGFDDLLVGAQGGVDEDGTLFGYFGSALGPASQPDFELPYASASHGAADVAYAGDLNGDGRDDVATVEGTIVSLYTDPANDSTPDKQLSDVESHLLCYNTRIAGDMDLNEDGHPDFVEGCEVAGDDESGRVYVFLGNGIDVDEPPAATLRGEAYSSFGSDVACGGDVDGDSFDDLLVGARDGDDGQGSIYVWWGEAGGLDDDEFTRRDGLTESEDFGAYLAGPGDVDGDGYSDVVVSAYAYDGYSGRVDFFVGTDRSTEQPDTGTDSGNVDTAASDSDTEAAGVSEDTSRQSDGCGCASGGGGLWGGPLALGLVMIAARRR